MPCDAASSRQNYNDFRLNFVTQGRAHFWQMAPKTAFVMLCSAWLWHRPYIYSFLALLSNQVTWLNVFVVVVYLGLDVSVRSELITY